jgi:hypothetical protein
MRHGATAINRLKPKLANGETGPVIEPGGPDPEIAHRQNGHG